MKKKLRNNNPMTIAEFRMTNRQTIIHHSSFFILHLLLASIISMFVLACSSKNTSHENADTYICPMHPTVVSDKPSTCPVCGMDLVRKERPGEEVKMTEELNRLIKSPNETVIASIKTMRPEYKAMPIELTLLGTVSYDERNTANISARVGGRLEKVSLKYAYQPVNKGQKVAEIYSAELVNAQRELLYLLQADASNTGLIEAAKSKLLLLGATDAQIQSIIQTKEVLYTFPVLSNVTGFIISESTTPPTAPTASAMSASATSSDGMGMGGSSASASPSAVNNSSVMIREGNYVSTGQTIFKTVNANAVWIEFRVMGHQGKQLKVGDVLTLRDGQNLKIDFIEPFGEGGEDFMRIRSYARGEQLLIGQLVEASMTKETKESLWLPKEAVTDLGINKVIFVKERGQFKPRTVVTGMETNGRIEIQKGLVSGDDVAVNAQYLIDSESFVKISN